MRLTNLIFRPCFPTLLAFQKHSSCAQVCVFFSCDCGLYSEVNPFTRWSILSIRAKIVKFGIESHQDCAAFLV